MRRDPRPIVAVAALLAALATLALTVLREDARTLHVRFANAGQLVRGGEVQVAGRKVGSIERVSLTRRGLADVELSIRDADTTPLHVGTRARIRAVGQAGVANRFVELSPGSQRAPQIPDGAVLPLRQTTSIVDIDALFDSFGARERASLQRLIANSAQVYAGSGSRYFNHMLGELHPSLAEVSGFAREIEQDRVAVDALVRTASRTAGAMASRRPDLTAAVATTARSFGAIAAERRALAGTLRRAPGALRQARTTLGGADTAVRSLRPALREVPPAAGPLRDFLARTRTTLPKARPVVARLRAELPALNRSLTGLVDLEGPAVDGLRSTREALASSKHIIRGMRFYGSDLILGIFNGLAGVATGNYTDKGHYARLEFTQNLETALGGQGAPLTEKLQPLPGIVDVRTKLLRRCPGGNVPPAIDGSSPWIPDPTLCTPEHNTPESVNRP